MTPARMSPEVRAELSALSRKSKAEFRAWLNNKFQIILGANDSDADNTKLPPLVRAQARLRQRLMAQFQSEIEIILDLNPNRNLGATEKSLEVSK